MTLAHLIFKELSHRRANGVLGLMSIGAAACCLSAAMAALALHDMRT